MSYSRRQLYAMGEPLGEGATRREVGGKIIYGGGGGGTPEKQTTVVDIPEWAKPYAKESLGKASALSATPYQTYRGERVAQFTPLQKQAFGRAENQQVAEQIGAGSGLAGTAGLMGLVGGYQPGQFGSQMSQYMSPYMDAVVQQQMDSAQRQADIASTQRGAQAVRAGAFGGSRQAIENAEAARALASQKGQIQATGLQSAYDRATDMYGREQALAEQSRQAGLSTALGAAGQLGQLGQQQFGQQMDITGQQAQFGGQQRQATQDILNQQYQDFLNQQRAPYDQLAFMTSMIRGTPMGQTTTMYQPPASQTSQLIGLGTAAAGAYGAYNKAAGGEVQSYAEGGGISALNQPQMAAMADGMSDQQLGQIAQMPSITELAKMTLAAEAQQRAQMRQQATAQQAMMQPQPQTTVAEDQMAAIGGLSDLAAPNLEGMGEGMAGGGIVSFEVGGAIYGGRRFEDLQPYRAGAYFRAGDKRIDPATNQPITFADFLQLQQKEKAAAAAPAAQAVIQRELQATPKTAANTVATQKSEATAAAGIPREKAEQVAPVTGKPAVSAERAGAGATPVGLSALQAQTASGMNALKGQMEDINKARTDAAQAAVERAKAQEAEMGEYGVEEGKRLKAREEGLKGAEDKNFNMALIEAGLAMMSGTSANAFENIGKGALVGTKAYTTGIERIQSRKEKLDDAVSALENAKRSDKRVSQERMDRLQANVDNAKTANAEALYTFGSKALDMSREDARFATEVALKQAQIAASNKQSFEERMVMALGKGDMAAGYKALKAMDAKPADLMGEFNDFLKANPMLATGPQEQAITAYMRSKLALSGLGAVPPASRTASGPVRD